MENALGKKLGFGRLLLKNNIYVIVLLLLIIPWITIPDFGTAGSMVVLVKNISLWGIMAMGMTFVLILGMFDMSIGMNASMLTVILAMLAQSVSLWIAIPVVLLLGGAILILPILPGASWKPVGIEAPLLRILLLLTAVVGLPFFLLSTTSPLLSYWFAMAFPGSSPYRLYALSNLGSMLGLLTYPTLVEPYLPIRVQAYAWSGAFLAFSLMSAFAAGKGTFSLQDALPTTPGPAGTRMEHPSAPPGTDRWFFWIALPACGSVLLLGVTNHLTQNVAAIPFLWEIGRAHV